MGTISFSGLASGIDADAIIKTITDSRRLAALPTENKIAFNEAENRALDELNTKFLTLRDSLSDFLTLTGGALSKNANSGNPDAVTAVAGSNALNATTSLTVESIASSATLSFDDRFSSASDPLAASLTTPATIEFTVGSGDDAETISIEVDDETSLTTLATAITEQSDNKLIASVANTGTEANPEYILLVQGADTGVQKGSLAVTIPPELSGLGLFGSHTLSQAQDAVIDIAGIGRITRSNNQINDIIPGLSLSLKQVTPAPVIITVSDDADETAEKLNNVVTAINDIISFSKEKDKIERIENDDRATNIFGDLAKTRLDDQAVDSIRSAITASRSTLPETAVRTFADLGVTTDRDGTYKFDLEKFTESVSDDPLAAGEILANLADQLASTDGLLYNYTKFQGVIDLAKQSNDSENESHNERLERLDRSIERQTELLRRTYTNLESTISRLNSEGDALVSMLSSLRPS